MSALGPPGLVTSVTYFAAGLGFGRQMMNVPKPINNAISTYESRYFDIDTDLFSGRA